MDGSTGQWGTIICESEEWINKSSGLGKLRIILNEGKDNEEEILWSNNILLPFTPYEQAFEKLFSWAHITIDYDFYEQFDIEDYELDNGYYDSEEEEYITDYSYYDDYLKSMPSIRPYIIESGELAKCRLVLTLNDLGKSFLNINDHIYTKNKSNRPVKEKNLIRVKGSTGMNMKSIFQRIYDSYLRTSEWAKYELP